MKKNKGLAAVFCLMVFSLSSCFYFRHGSGGLVSTRQKDSGSSRPIHYVNQVSYQTVKTGSAFNLNNTNIGLGYGYHYLPSTGDVKLLVLPIASSDYEFTTTQLSRLSQGFFGESGDTGWESVSSFYEKSSGNKLHITGAVAPVVQFTQSADELFAEHQDLAKNGVQATDVFLKSALSAIAEQKKFDFSPYDTNHDGYINAVWMVYAMPEVKKGDKSDLYWAFTTWTSDTTKFSGLYASTYAWASIDFLDAGKYENHKADAHTFIHETGHMMGLDDYYSYDADAETNFDSPVGGIDMMDFNIADHDSFSKFLLGWYKPTLVTEEYLKSNNYRLTLPSFENTGKSFLIPAKSNGEISYNQTPFDEYLLVEYYTPTGLAKKDAFLPYGDSGISAYSQDGVLVYHVNASIGKLVLSGDGSLVSDGNVYDALPDYDDTWGKSFLYAYLNSNTQSRSYGQVIDDSQSNYYRTRLLSLLPATGKKTIYTREGLSSNRSLFQPHTSLKKSYRDFRFDDGSYPAFDFEVTSIRENTDCTLLFSGF